MAHQMSRMCGPQDLFKSCSQIMLFNVSEGENKTGVIMKLTVI